jgi:Holliday junction resolvase
MEIKKYKETSETQKFQKELRLNGFFVRKISDRFHGGLPDIVAICKGQVFWIEMKVNKNKMTALQEQTTKEIAEKGGLPLCITIRQDINGEKEFLLERISEEGKRILRSSFSDVKLLVFFLKKNIWN